MSGMACYPNWQIGEYIFVKKLFVEMQQSEHKLHHLLPNVETNAHGLCSSAKYQVPKCNTKRAKGSFINWCLFNLQ